VSVCSASHLKKEKKWRGPAVENDTDLRFDQGPSLVAARSKFKKVQAVSEHPGGTGTTCMIITKLQCETKKQPHN
jgi:hypothetical protein